MTIALTFCDDAFRAQRSSDKNKWNCVRQHFTIVIENVTHEQRKRRYFEHVLRKPRDAITRTAEIYDYINYMIR